MKEKFKERILITGGAGFIGSNYLNKYVPINPTRLFINIDALTYAGTLSNVQVRGAKNYAFHKVDLRDAKKLRSIFKRYEPTAVIHFAAESHVDLSIKNPGIFIETNVEGTNNLLLLAKEFKVKRFHHISTDEVYGALSGTGKSFTEVSPLAPRNPYSASKAGADLLVHVYHETFGLNTVITRSSNIFGPGQDTSKLIPSFMYKLLRGEKVPLYSQGEHVREWTYVEDCVDAIHRVFEKGKSGEVYNIASGYELTNLALTKKIISLTGRDESYIKRVPDRLGHDFRYSLNTRKIRTILGWKPRVSFEHGLTKTLEFVKAKLHGKKR
jgi:dTDP-glucose 4,6-dehydratase